MNESFDALVSKYDAKDFAFSSLSLEHDTENEQGRALMISSSRLSA